MTDQTMPEPLNPMEEADLRGYHRPLQTADPAVIRCNCDFSDDPVGDVEGRDAYIWPCSAARLLATLDAERAKGLDVARLTQALINVNGHIGSGNADSIAAEYASLTRLESRR